MRWVLAEKVDWHGVVRVRMGRELQWPASRNAPGRAQTCSHLCSVTRKGTNSSLPCAPSSESVGALLPHSQDLPQVSVRTALAMGNFIVSLRTILTTQPTLSVRSLQRRQAGALRGHVERGAHPLQSLRSERRDLHRPLRACRLLFLLSFALPRSSAQAPTSWQDASFLPQAGVCSSSFNSERGAKGLCPATTSLTVFTCLPPALAPL